MKQDFNSALFLNDQDRKTPKKGKEAREGRMAGGKSC